MQVQEIVRLPKLLHDSRHQTPHPVRRWRFGLTHADAPRRRGVWRLGVYLIPHRTLLLFAHLGVELAIIGRALRDAGYLVFPARFHEEGVDAVVRVRPDLVLIEATHYPTIVTPEFRRLIADLGTKVLVYARQAGIDDAAALQALQPFAYPILEFTGDGRALAALIVEVHDGYAA